VCDRHPIYVSAGPETVVTSRDSVLHVRESLRERNGPLENRSLQPLSPGPVLPHFPDQAASIGSTQGNHSIDDATGLRAEMALRMARRVEERAELKGCSGSGSGAREGREIDGAVLVRVKPTAMASTAPSMPGETTGNSSTAFHPAGSRGAPPPGGTSASSTGNAVGSPQAEVQLMVLLKVDHIEVC